MEVDRFIKLEKKRRNRVCKQRLGKRGEYDPDIDVYAYDSLQQLISKQPFRAPFSDCGTVEAGVDTKDPTNRYFTRVRHQAQCEDVKGIWKERTLSRINKKDDGTCWTNEADAKCADKYDAQQSACDEDDACKWAMNECFSRETFDGMPTIFPEDWPKDIVRSDIQSYLNEFFTSGRYRPPTHLSLFGMGNRCTPKELSKSVLSMPQVVVASVMKGLANNPDSTNRGLLVWHSTGSGKCHAKDTPILMYDGRVKLVQDIDIGDLLMGDDSTPRTVLSLATGLDTMYDIHQAGGDTYTVNSEHILCLKQRGIGMVTEITVTDYLQLPKGVKSILFGYSVGVDFPTLKVQMDPYLIGVRMGSNLFESIPAEFKINCRKIRLAVLAGLIDAIGVIRNNAYVVRMHTQSLADDVIFLARSLGLSPSCRCKRGVFCCGDTSYEIFISGESMSDIPLQRHARIVRGGNGDVDVSLKKVAITALGTGEYFGFTLDGNSRYLLGDFTVTHNTCTATGVIDAFWETTKNIVFVTSVEASGSNPPSNFHKCAQRFFPRFKQMPLDRIKSAFDKRKVMFFTFAQLAHYLLIANPLKRVTKPDDIERHKNYLNDAVIIIDEVHNVFKPLPNQRLENNAVRKFLEDYNNKRSKNLKVVILTATPGNSADDVVALMNMVRDKKSEPIVAPNLANSKSVDDFTARCKGLVSYFDMSKDYTKFPKVEYQKQIEAPMETKQFLKYIEAYNQEPASARDFDGLAKKDTLERYYKKSRKYANMLYNFEKDMLINEFSSKVPLLLDTIAKHPDQKHYVYSAFFERRGFGGQGIPGIAKFLESQLGYKKMTVTEAGRMTRAVAAGESFPKAKRYVMALSAELAGDRENLNALVNAFNAAINVNGEYVSVFLASQGYNEGVDLKAVRHIHIFEPLLSISAEQQTVGRAARFCSHSDLDLVKWTVQIHRYISTAPMDLSAFNGNYVKDRLDSILMDISELEERLNVIKGERGPTVTRVRDNLKKDILARRVDIRGLKTKLREIEKLNIGNVNMIDEQLMRERVDKARALLQLYDIIRKQAVDYLLLKDFHDSSYL